MLLAFRRAMSPPAYPPPTSRITGANGLSRCQTTRLATSLPVVRSLAQRPARHRGCHSGSRALSGQHHLEWANDEARCRKAGVPDDIGFMTKPEIALEQIRWACEAGLPRGVVLMDAGYGASTELRS